MSKYEGDGHLETIEPYRFMVGCVVRRTQSDGGLPTFSDSVVTGIRVTTPKMGNTTSAYAVAHKATWYLNLGDALTSAAEANGDVIIKLARPYLYAHNIGGAIPDSMMGVENYEVTASQLLNAYSVVVQSTGEYAKHNLWNMTQ